MAEKKIQDPQDGEMVALTEIDNLEEEKDWARNETAEFIGKYTKSVGRRKQAVAQVRLYEAGKGVIMINGKRAT